MPLSILARKRPVAIAAYSGFRNESAMELTVRILKRVPEPGTDPTRAAKLLYLLRLYASHEVTGVRVRLTYGDLVTESVSDDEGFARFELQLPSPRAMPLHTDWEHCRLELPDIAGTEPVDAAILAPGTDHRVAIISDIDDTIIETGAHRFTRNWRRLILQMPEDRLGVDGASDFYAQLGNTQPQRGARRAFFYVSSSPWNLYGFLMRFMRLQSLPEGPMLLRDWSFSLRTLGRSSHGAHKRASIARILGFYPDLRFILIGDDTQGDPEAYADAVTAYPGRVEAVLIRTTSHEALGVRKKAAIDRIRASGVAIWVGSAFDAGQHMLARLGLDEAGDAARVVEANQDA
ncbi:phosphatase domain-containing protein [Novosphingopyxis sp.]|uniref:phosphatase domain-containing protein n=1 Tax=Novosphingopyxis sp. TaxID=2709690 RepID=UPI003B58EE9C